VVSQFRQEFPDQEIGPMTLWKFFAHCVASLKSSCPSARDLAVMDFDGDAMCVTVPCRTARGPESFRATLSNTLWSYAAYGCVDSHIPSY
jgi:hypothetical protein